MSNSVMMILEEVEEGTIKYYVDCIDKDIHALKKLLQDKGCYDDNNSNAVKV